MLGSLPQDPRLSRVTSPSGRFRDLLRGSAGIAVAMAVMNVATYAFQVASSRILGPDLYGPFARLMALLLVVGVLQLGLQATAARRIAAEPHHVAQIEREILRVTYRAALALGGLLLLLAPLVNIVLRLESLATAALVALAAVPLTIMGGQAGILQGERRWFPLAILYMAVGVPRFVIGTAFILWRPTEASAMIAVAIGLVAPCLVGWYALRRGRDAAQTTADHAARPIIRETLHNSQALLAFFVLSNADVIVAGNVLNSRVAGLYAGALIVTKAVLFLPQFIVVIAFPSMSTADARRRALTRSLMLVGAVGAACTAGTWVLSDLAVKFIGGEKYSAVEGRLWMFAVLGTALALLQLLVYSVLARRGQRSVYFLWAAVAVVIAAGVLVDTITGLLLVVVATDAVLFGVLLGLSLYRMREPVDVSESSADA